MSLSKEILNQMTLDEKIKEERINESTKRILDVKVDRGIIKFNFKFEK